MDSKKINRKHIFELAEDFHRCSLEIIPDDLFENDNDDGHWIIPAIVNISFACELYLKSIIISKNEIKRHNLYDLFEVLPTNIKAEILTSPEFNGDDEFYEKLEEQKNVFTDWRYCYEKPCSVDVVFLENLASVLNRIAENLCRQQ